MVDEAASKDNTGTGGHRKSRTLSQAREYRNASIVDNKVLRRGDGAFYQRAVPYKTFPGTYIPHHLAL